MSIDATTVFGRLRIRTTDDEPHEDGERRGFRWRKRSTSKHADGQVLLSDAAPAPTRAAGVELADTAPAMTSVADVLPPRGPASVPNSPEPARPAPPRADATPPYDLSAPIDPFPDDDDQSPIHDVTPPEDLSDLDDARVDRPRDQHAEQVLAPTDQQPEAAPTDHAGPEAALAPTGLAVPEQAAGTKAEEHTAS